MRRHNWLLAGILSGSLLLALLGILNQPSLAAFNAGDAPAPPPGTLHPQATATITVTDITFTSSWDGSTQRASIARLDPWAPTGPVPLVIYVHGWIQCADEAPHHTWAASDIRGVPVAQRGWLFAAPELHGERPLNQDAYDIGTWCPNVSVGYRPLGARPAQRDILDLIDYMLAHYNVDPNRIYLLSDSAGALTALTTLAKFPDLFAAAVEYSGPTDLALWYRDDETTGPGTYYPNIRREVGGTPTEVPYDYARRSPITFAENLALVPLAIVHGTADTKVPPHHAQNLYNAIKRAAPDAPVELYWFNGGHSGPSDPYTITWALDWLSTHTRSAAPTALRLLTDAGGTPGVPGEPELGPFDRFWWLGWTPRPGTRRWTRVALTHTVATFDVSGIISDTVGLTLTLDLDRLGWPNQPVSARVIPPAPTPAYTQTLTPTGQSVSLPVPAGSVRVHIQAPTPTPTPTPTPSTGTITGRVFHDLNANGVPDTGEPGLAGAVIHLLQGGATPSGVYTTTATGTFTFTGLTPGGYLVRETNPPGYTDTTVSARYVIINTGEVVSVHFGDRKMWQAWLPVLTR